MSETNPFPTDLDQQQIFQRAFNQDTDRIRVDAELSASILPTPGLEVSISSVDDNIAIRNSNNSNELLINADGSINVNTSGSGSSDVNLTKIDGITTSVNNGTADAGTLRVAIASDNTAFSVNAIQNGVWTTGRTWVLDSSTDSVNIGNFPATVAVTQSTSPWVISGTVAATQSGTWNINDISGTISLPTGASTSSNQTNGSQKTQIVDGSGNIIASTSNALNVNVNNTVPISGTITVNQGTSPWVTSASQSGTWNIGTVTTLTSITNAVTVAQATASSLNATVVGTGTFAVQAAQSGTWTIQPGNTANTTPWLVSTKTALTASAPTATTVGVASASAVASNSSRKGLILTNTSSNNISLGIGATAILNSGITLYPGGTWQMDETSFTTATINAIASSSSSNLAIQEFT